MIGISTTDMDLEFSQYPSISICQFSVENNKKDLRKQCNMTKFPQNLNKTPNMSEILNGLSYFDRPRSVNSILIPLICRPIDMVTHISCAVCSRKSVTLNSSKGELVNRDIYCQQNHCVQGGWGGWPTGNRKKLSSSQAQLGQATCLDVAYFLSIS